MTIDARTFEAASRSLTLTKTAIDIGFTVSAAGSGAFIGAVVNTNSSFDTFTSCEADLDTHRLALDSTRHRMARSARMDFERRDRNVVVGAQFRIELRVGGNGTTCHATANTFDQQLSASGPAPRLERRHRRRARDHGDRRLHRDLPHRCAWRAPHRRGERAHELGDARGRTGRVTRGDALDERRADDDAIRDRRGARDVGGRANAEADRDRRAARGADRGEPRGIDAAPPPRAPVTPVIDM